MYIDSMVVMGLYFQMQEGSGAFGVRVHGAIGASPLGTTGSAHRAGWFKGSFMLWKSCIGLPSQPKLASSLPIKRPSYYRLTFGGENRTTALSGDGNAPLFPLRGTSPGGGSSSGAMLCDTCEIIAFRSFIMPPLLWRHRRWILFCREAT